MPKTTSKIFLDASVIIAAFGSTGGGSATILSHQGKSYQCIVSLDIIAEVLVKAKKLKTTEKELKNFINEKNVIVTASPSEEEKSLFDKVVKDKKDRHVLAAAKIHKAHFLLSYDRQHIVVEEVKKALHPTAVMTPKEFLKSKPLT